MGCIPSPAVKFDFFGLFKLDKSGLTGVKGVIGALFNIGSGKIFSSSLAYQNFASVHFLALLALDAQPFCR